MSEPKGIAARAERVVEGVHWWTVPDDRIGGMPSNAMALEDAAGSVVLIDPIRLEKQEFEKLGKVSAIVLTLGSHQRAAGHYRKLTGAPVWAPAGSEPNDFEPDEVFEDGGELPGTLTAISLPGAAGSPFEFECAPLARCRRRHVVGDALLNVEGHGGFCVFPEEFNTDPEKTRQSCRRLFDHDFDVLLFGHGEPMRSGARERLRDLLEAS